jgi:hypothetical protein
MVDPSFFVYSTDKFLAEMGWTRSHPMVENFINQFPERYRVPSTNLESLPLKYIVRLEGFLVAYFACNNMLLHLKLTWESSLVTEITSKYGGYEKMPYVGWQQLSKRLYEEMATYIQQEDIKKKKAGVKKGKYK